ncbi:MAG TPA: LacI family DNA-binding transcriptional regulator [Vicinamibacterales bacterium]|nr:LacI family DNA-binding transcriptional regulator [Vicinamibacterales bacterium]
MAKINDVARRAGVSTATVSRVLSNAAFVSPATRRRVMAAVEHLGYAPNATAKNLRMLRTRRLIVTVPDISRPMFSLILQGIEESAHREGYAVLLGDTQYDQGREERYAEMLQAKEADGLIFLGRKLSNGLEALVRSTTERRAPVVNALGFIPQLGIPSVQIDNHAAAVEAMDHLYRLGHRHIGIVTGPALSFVSDQRLLGARERAKKERADRHMVVMNGDFSIDSGVVAGERLLGRTRPPTAIFCLNDEMAMGVIHTARRRKIRIPDDLSVVGVDDIRYARYTDPPLTTVAQPMRQMGENAVRVLLDLLNNRDPSPPDQVVLPHTLVVRASTAPPGRW